MGKLTGRLFKTAQGKAYVVCDGLLTEAEALKLANQHFKVAKCQLDIAIAYVLKDSLYFEHPGNKKAKLVWAVSRER